MSSSRTNRRRFLMMAGGGLAAGGALYAWQRGVRFPPGRLVDAGPARAASTAGVELSASGAAFQEQAGGELRFRAFAPEPVFTARGRGEARIVIENLHPGATLEAGGRGASERSLSEDRDGLTRSVTLTAAGEELDFSWRFPKREQYRFAAIGDSGGGSELEWVLRRAADLGADFLIHLGDIYYEKGDFERASRNLNAASIPTYAAIGNHDFHQGWRVLYPRFHRLVGPGNSKFRLGGIEFVNVDTAADFIPAARGRRARILGGLTPIDGNADVRDRVAFTHTPLADPDPERHHAVGRAAEARWLRERFLAAGTRHLLAGHIHIKAELDDQGLYTYITGQGLGHADLIGPEAYRSFAEILVGEVEPGEPVRYRWQPLEMPFEAHCSARNLRMFEVLDRPDVKARLMRACGKS